MTTLNDVSSDASLVAELSASCTLPDGTSYYSSLCSEVFDLSQEQAIEQIKTAKKHHGELKRAMVPLAGAMVYSPNNAPALLREFWDCYRDEWLELPEKDKGREVLIRSLRNAKQSLKAILDGEGFIAYFPNLDDGKGDCEFRTKIAVTKAKKAEEIEQLDRDNEHRAQSKAKKEERAVADLQAMTIPELALVLATQIDTSGKNPFEVVAQMASNIGHHLSEHPANRISEGIAMLEKSEAAKAAKAAKATAAKAA